jgi:hypothetical protein
MDRTDGSIGECGPGFVLHAGDIGCTLQ